MTTIEKLEELYEKVDSQDGKEDLALRILIATDNIEARQIREANTN